jgi:uncharacterized protein YndB with AHSA1/START domain
MKSLSHAIGDEELLIERELDAPVELVFELWERAEHVARWWGPEEFTATRVDWALQPGKAWRMVMASRQHGVFGMGGMVREVERNRRLAFTFSWDEDSGRDLDTLITVTFEARGERTLQRFHQTPFSTRALRDGHAEGWNSLFDKQVAYAANVWTARRSGRQ